MRVSTDREDPGYTPGVRARCYVDGVLIHRAVTADDEAGVVVRFAVDENGQFKLDRLNRRLLLETLRGEVRIEVFAV